MRLWRYLPLPLLLVVSSALSSEVPWNPPSTVQSTTLVDVLNADKDYSLLLSLLQRTRLIPTLNKLNGSTFFAPTNDAVKRRSGKDSVLQRALEDDNFQLPDNVQEQLRQQLFYHLINETITLPEDSTQVLKTLHYPKQTIDPPTHEPPTSPPWLPVPEGTLGAEPQRLRITSRDGSYWVATDSFGQGGVQVTKGRANATNGDVYGISDMLEVPPSLARVVENEESLSYLQKILIPELKESLNNTSELTLFIPVDDAWKSLDPLERLYLESEFSEDDRRRILDMHSVVEGGVKWSDSFESSTKLTTKYGSVLDIEVSSEVTTISGAKLVQSDIFASNGVLHLVSSLLIPPGALKLTPEKYLLALNCTSFVSLLHSVNLTNLVNNSDHHYTILAPKDDVFSLVGDGLPKEGSEELKRMLQYHFIPGNWTPKKLHHEGLLETELREPGLDNGRQVLQVEVHAGEKSSSASKHIAFGGAGVIGDHVEFDKTVIYFISRPLEPPVDPLQTALPTLDLSSFLAAVFSTSLADVIKKTPRTTFLIPRNTAFKRLGHLVSDHLLAASSKTDLENVILHHVIDSVQYSKSLVNGSQRTFATLEGSDLQLERLENGSVTIRASGGWAGMKGALYPKNTLTETGVIHEVSDLMIPRTVELNVGKLVKAAKATTMANLLMKAGFDWVVNGTAPPEDSEWAGKGLEGVSWTVLCPTDDAFKKFNLTRLLSNPEVLRSIVSQHLIPTPPASPATGHVGILESIDNNRPLPLNDLGTYSTLLSPSSAYGDVVFRALDDKTDSEYMVGIKNARGTEGKADWARVLSWGRTTTGGGDGGVIQVDRLLMPYHPPWWVEYGAPSFVGVVGVIAICLFFYGVYTVWNKEPEATYEPVGGFEDDD
ncbi:hypothetical protein ID866_1164 [Astraeus odoratus]|nr:hypothetical protein ID866_1164 [Astraeus odoratus]